MFISHDVLLWHCKNVSTPRCVIAKSECKSCDVFFVSWGKRVACTALEDFPPRTRKVFQGFSSPLASPPSKKTLFLLWSRCLESQKNVSMPETPKRKIRLRIMISKCSNLRECLQIALVWAGRSSYRWPQHTNPSVEAAIWKMQMTTTYQNALGPGRDAYQCGSLFLHYNHARVATRTKLLCEGETSQSKLEIQACKRMRL